MRNLLILNVSTYTRHKLKKTIIRYSNSYKEVMIYNHYNIKNHIISLKKQL